MASRLDKSYDTYLRYIREAEQKGIQHEHIITRAGWRTAVKEAKDMAGPSERNFARFLEGESRVNRVSSVRALRQVLKISQQDIRVGMQQGETVTPLGRIILNQKRTLQALNEADVKGLWRAIHDLYSRDEIYAMLDSPKGRKSS
jgi:hypothetical protein